MIHSFANRSNMLRKNSIFKERLFSVGRNLKMGRETKLNKYIRHFRSERFDITCITKVTDQYLNDTIGLLDRRLKKSQISQEQYHSRITEIENIRNEITNFQEGIKNEENSQTRIELIRKFKQIFEKYKENHETCKVISLILHI